ncbi:MAG: hypothetical protein P1U44_05800 [Vicingaceae bacterium]|nr:hypothetical protein [Vicingaceae bacterium]
MALIQMKKYTVLILLTSYLSVNGQDFDYTPVIFELLPIHPHTIIDQQDSEFSIEQYKKSDKNNSMIFIGGLFFKKINDTVFQTRLYKKQNSFKKKEYWKFNKDNYVQQCDEGGNIKDKWIYNGFETYEYSTSKEDSIVEKIEWIVLKKDTVCHFLDKWIYKNDQLIEKWHKSLSLNKCSWDLYDNIEFKTFKYPKNNTVITEVYRGSITDRKKINEYKTTKEYNKAGQLILKKHFSKDDSDNPSMIDKYYYKDNQWLKVEYWIDGVLTEVIKIKN